MQKNLYALRKTQDLTQYEMAQKLGISTRAYNRKELGITQFTGNEMFTLSKLFDEPIEQIFLPTDVPESHQKQLEN